MSAIGPKQTSASALHMPGNDAAVLGYRPSILSLKIISIAWRISHLLLGLSINCQREGDLARLRAALSIREEVSAVMARQAQALADQTKVFGQKIQHAAQELAKTASGAMAEASRRAENGQAAMAEASRRAEQASKRQRAEA